MKPDFSAMCICGHELRFHVEDGCYASYFVKVDGELTVMDCDCKSFEQEG